MTSTHYKNALEAGYELLWYRIEGVLGQGAFGITYLAHDIYLDRQVAIKEYMPGQFSMRLQKERIEPISNDLKKDYRSGLKRFLSEARTLTKFKHPNLVQVFNIFEKNNTAYMVMSYEVGKSLKQILKSRQSLGELELMHILVPLMNGLEMMHDKGFIHRDVKPGNIFIRDDNSPVLLDFGSARQTHYFFSDDNDEESQVKTLTNFVSPGYTPIEQYTGKSNRQGPWTDIYALGATLYKCITGRMPIEAVERSESIAHISKDEYIKLADIAAGQYSKSFLSAIDHSLAFKAQQRPQTIKEWKLEFGITEDDVETIEVSRVHKDSLESKNAQSHDNPQASDEDTTEHIEHTLTEETALFINTSPAIPARQSKSKLRRLPYALAASILVVFILAYLINTDPQQAPEQPDPAQSVADKTIEIQQPPETAAGDAPASQENTAEMVKTQEVSSDKREQADGQVIVEEAAAEQPTAEQLAAIRQQQEIENLLTMAATDIQAEHYTQPENNNAFEKYQLILSMDPDNADAKRGIQILTDKFMYSAYRAIDNNQFAKAEDYLAEAEKLSPGLETIDRARAQLKRKQQAYAKAETAPPTKPEQPAKPAVKVTQQPVATSTVVVEDGVTIVDKSREIPEEQSDSIPDNDIDRTINKIKNIFQ